MGTKFAWLVVLLLALTFPTMTALRPPDSQPTHFLPSSTHHAVEYQFASGGSMGFFYVGAFASHDSDPSNVPNSGVRGTIQVVSQQTSGCLSYWVDDDSEVNIWGQVGYYICNGATPVAFYQIWNLYTYSVLVTGTSSVSEGDHSFSMYSVNGGDTWAYALDGNLIGTYNMGANISSSSYGVSVYSEEGYVGSPYQPARQVELSAMQTYDSSVWSPIQIADEPWGCGNSGMSCWGIQGNLQNSSLSAGEFVTGGTTPLISGGALLWNSRSANSQSTLVHSGGNPSNETTSGTSSTGVTSNTSVSCSSLTLVGNSTTCTAAVTGNSPIGKVTWSTSGFGKFSSHACKLKDGACSVKYTPTSASSPVNITASYVGDKHNLASAGTYSLAISTKASAVNVSCARSSLVVGSSKMVNCTAKVSGYSPTGEVTWSQSGNGSVSFTSTTCTLIKARCYVTLNGTAVGTVTVQAAYGGDGNNTNSSSMTAKLMAVKQAKTSLSRSCSSMSDDVWTCTATLEGYFGHVANETVAWSQVGGAGGVSFSSAECRLSSNGSCSTTVTGSSPGRVKIAVAYGGDLNNRGASKTARLKVIHVRTSLALSCTSTLNNTWTCTSTLGGYLSSAANESIAWSQVAGSGSVSFPSATCFLASGSCSLDLTGASNGSVTIAADYHGDSIHSSSSDTFVITVGQHPLTNDPPTGTRARPGQSLIST